VQPPQPQRPSEAEPVPTEEPVVVEEEEPAAEETVEEAAPTEEMTEEPEEESAAEMVSFANDVLPIFEASCKDCHIDQRRGGLNVGTHTELMSRNVINAGDAANSELIELVISGEMPPRGDDLTDAQIQILSDWVNQGALDN
jgi:cytochrome c5